MDAVNNLKPGQSVQISESNGIKVFAERSGNGKRLTFFRQTANGFETFLRRAF